MSKGKDKDTSSVVWKKVYLVVTGNTTIAAEIVGEILEMVKPKLITGFLEYPPYTKESLQVWKDTPGLKLFADDDEMCNFVNRLGKELNLDVMEAWIVVCNYLMLDYYGKVDELKLIIRYDTRLQVLIDNIWYFYSGDRMFLLKTLRHVFEHAYNKEHKFHRQFDKFVKSLNTKQLWLNLLIMFNTLIEELNIDIEKDVTTETMTRWIHRNNREQVDVAILLTHVIQHFKLEGNELEEVLLVFMRHGFTRHPLYSGTLRQSKPKDLVEIKTAEIGCVLAVMERYWQAPAMYKILSETVEKNLEQLQIQGDNSILLFAWSVLKTSLSNTDEAMEYCNNVTCELIKKKVFTTLHQFLTNKIFAECKSGDIVIEAVFKLMAEFIKICADYGYLHEQEGICYVTAELVKRKGIIVLDYLGPIFQLSIDAFPFVFNPFLEMCKSMMSLPGYFDTIMELLKNIPSFLAELPWNDHRERFNLVGTQKLFIDSELFIIPEGTVVERFRYQGYELAKFVYKFSFFLLMEQFTKSLSVISFEMGKKWYCYDNLSELVRLGFEFINDILKYYKGDFRADTVLRTLVQRLEIVPTQFYQGPTKNFNFIRLYFKTNFNLITSELLDFTEAFPPIMRKKVIPQVTNFDKSDEQLFFSQMNSDSVLFKSLKEEEGMDDHSLLLEYLKLIDNMVERDLYHQELQMAGVWYVLNVVFPLHLQWRYEDEKQKVTLCKACIGLLVKVLQNRDVDKKEKSYEIYTMCAEAFMFEEVLMGTFLTVFYKDKFYLQNVMEEESNWISGPAVEYIHSIRLEMVLLLLLYKSKHNVEKRKSTIDRHIGLICRTISAYMINPYNSNIRILSLRFLDILARDEDIYLMALLGLDYDQIQRLFLDRLRDPMEDDTVKLQTLELIATCILHQHGMTAAFFNVKTSKKWYSDNKDKTIEGDSVADFMIDYLQNIRKSQTYLRSPLQVGILKVMANLWISGKHHLVKEITDLDAFWPLLINPLFHEFNQKSLVYSYILTILSKQFELSGKSRKFLTQVERFITNEKQLTLWAQYFLKIVKPPYTLDQIEEHDSFMKSWMEFLMMVEKEPGIKKISDPKIRYLFIDMCLEGMQYNLANIYCIESWISICSLQISYWGIHYEHKDPIVVKKIISMYSVINSHFSALGGFTRIESLSIIQIVLRDLQEYLQKNTTDLLELLEYVGPMMDYEHIVLEDWVWKSLIKHGPHAREFMIPWMSCIFIANILLKYENCADLAVWFCYRDYLNKLVKCTGDLLLNSETVPLSKVALRSLYLYVESPLANDFLNVNMIKFYDIIEPCITSLLYGKGWKIKATQLDEGWMICTLLMKFNRGFLRKFQYTALPTFYTFIMLSEPIIQHVLFIPEFTVALKALDLLVQTLTFFDELLMNWQLEWYRKANKTYNRVVHGVKKLVNSCLYTILRPKNISMYEVDDYDRLQQMEKYPVGLMVAIMNRLITAAGLGFSILYRINPNLVKLMDVYLPDTVTVLINHDFSVPKFELPIPNELTYGKLLCLAHFMCKTLDALNLQPQPKDVRLPEYYYNKCLGLVEHQDPDHNLPHQKLSVYLRYAMYEYSGLADPWIQKVDKRRVKKSLELLMMFLAQQVYLYIGTGGEGIPYYKRNLASELQFFYEYVKRYSALLLKQPESLPTLFKSESSTMKRYLMFSRESNKSDEVVEENFCVVLVQWFTKICTIR